MASARTRSIIEIVTNTKHPRLALILLAALALAGQLAAQIDLPAPDVPVPESGTEDQTEAAPSPEFIPGAPVQIRPDEGSPVAGTEVITPQFDIGRHLHLSGSLTWGYDDNVNLTPTGSPSWYANPTVSFGYRFGSARLAMDLLTGGGINYYFDHPGGRYYDPLVYLNLSVAYKVTPRLTLDFSTASAYESQPEFGTQFSGNRRLGNYFRSEDNVSAAYKLTPRLTSVTSYLLSALAYESSAASGNLQQTFSQQLRYLWFPTTTVSGEYRFSINGSQNGGSESTTQSVIAGLDQSFSPRFIAGLHSGVQFRSSGNNGHTTGATGTTGSTGGSISPYLQTSLRYELGTPVAASRGSGATTYIIWTNRYSIEESDVQGAAGRDTFRTNLELNYAITARISASLALIYFHGDNGSSNQMSSGSLGKSSTEDTFDITPSVRYAITQHCSVNVGYRYTDVKNGSGTAALEPFQSVASQSVASYTRSRYFAGITLSF